MSDDKTAQKGDWDEDFTPKTNNSGSQDGDNKDKFMSLSEEGNYRIRLVGNHVKFYRHWNPVRAITHYDYKSDDPAWQAGFYPSKRFAINVIDRRDGKLKILEKGTQIFKVFADYKSLFGKNPAGKDGPDFNIRVSIPGGDKRSTSYTVTHLEAAPFTEEEKSMIRENLYDLPKIYKSTPLEDIQKQWDALSDEAKIAPKRDKDGKKIPTKEAQKSAPAKEVMEDAPANDDDIFGDTNTNTNTEESAELF